MATVLDYLSSPEFADDRLTEAINVPEYQTGRPAQLGIFRDVAIPTTYVRLSVDNDEISIIPARERGGESNLNMREGRRGINFDIPHFPLDDAINPSDLQNILQWGEGYAFTMVADVLQQKLAAMRAKHERTWHHMDWGALYGNVVDAEGKVLANLFTDFGLTQTPIDFELSVTTTQVADRLGEVKTSISREVRGAPTNGVRIFASSSFYDAYVRHASVKEALQYYPAAGQINPARDDVTDEFRFGGAVIERVTEEFAWRKADGTFEMLPAIPDDEAIAIPMGTDYFRRYNAPPDSVNLANRRPDQSIFVSQHERPHGKGVEIHTESNRLSICTRPQVITRLTMS